MRIVGVRLEAPVARLLSEILRAERFPSTAEKVAGAIKRRAIDAPLTLDDHEAILEALSRRCPSTLYRLRERLLDEQRYVRRVTGG